MNDGELGIITKGETGTEVEKPDITDLTQTLGRRREVGQLALVGLFLLALLYSFYFARAFVLPIVLAILFNFILQPAVRGLRHLRIPEALGAAIVVLVTVGLIVFGLIQLSQPASKWLASAPEGMRRLETKAQKWIRPAQELSTAAEHVSQQTGDAPPTKVEVKEKTLASTFLGFTMNFVMGFVETVVILYFFLAAGNRFTRKLIKILPRFQDKKQAVEIANDVETKISRYLGTLMIINLVEGTVVAVVMYFLQMPNPILWGVLACFLNFIPYLGALVTALILVFVGLSTFDSTTRALLPAIIYGAINFAEGNILTPLVLGKRFTLNAGIVFISLMLWGLVWGIPGMLLAVPILMVLKILCDHIKALAPLGEFLAE